MCYQNFSIAFIFCMIEKERKREREREKELWLFKIRNGKRKEKYALKRHMIAFSFIAVLHYPLAGKICIRLYTSIKILDPMDDQTSIQP